jgi:hypothetical protein
VISYSYLWAREHGQGAEEGRKDRPSVIVAARQVIEGREVVTVVPVTHTPLRDPADAVEIPPALKRPVVKVAYFAGGRTRVPERWIRTARTLPRMLTSPAMIEVLV